MNAVLEMPYDDEPILTEAQVAAIHDPVHWQQQLQVVRDRLVVIKPIDPLTAKQCAALAVVCTVAAKHAESQRTAITDPLNQQVKEHNAIWQPIVKGFDELGRIAKSAVSQWVDEQRKAAERVQQRLIDEANAKQRALDDKARQEREEAERLRADAEKATTIDEAEALHQQADTLEKKAVTHELKASQVVTLVAPMPPKTLDLGSSSLSTKAPKNTYILPGWDKQKPLKLTDPKLALLLGDLAALPAGLQFVIKHADINPVYLNKSFGVLDFPAPFGIVPDYSGASVRGK